MKKFISFGLLLVMVACGVEETTIIEKDNDVSKNETEKKDVVANAEVEMNIEGMTCMINCVTAVKKALKNTEGVGDVTVDFDPDRAIDKATIKYDDKLVTEDKIKQVIEELNNGIYKVVDAPADSSSISEESKNDKSVISKVSDGVNSVSFKTYEIPSLFQVLNSFLF